MHLERRKPEYPFDVCSAWRHNVSVPAHLPREKGWYESPDQRRRLVQGQDLPWRQTKGASIWDSIGDLSGSCIRWGKHVLGSHSNRQKGPALRQARNSWRDYAERNRKASVPKENVWHVRQGSFLIREILLQGAFYQKEWQPRTAQRGKALRIWCVLGEVLNQVAAHPPRRLQQVV